jgi:hypothetical protein
MWLLVLLRRLTTTSGSTQSGAEFSLGGGPPLESFRCRMWLVLMYGQTSILVEHGSEIPSCIRCQRRGWRTEIQIF